MSIVNTSKNADEQSTSAFAAGSKWDSNRMLDTVKRSPIAVASHNRQAWLDLFSAASVVQDPVGTQPCNGPEQIGRFYDTFIANCDIRFDSLDDFVCGNAVARNVVIQTSMDTGVAIEVPAHLLYELDHSVDDLEIIKLNAYWELRKMIPQVLGQGVSGIKTMLVLSWRMLMNQGLATTVKYSDGMLRGIFEAGKSDVDAFAMGCGEGQVDFSLRLDSGFKGIEMPDGKSFYSFQEVCSSLDETLQIDQKVSAGFETSFVYEGSINQSPVRGMGVFEYNPKNKRIRRVRMFA